MGRFKENDLVRISAQPKYQFVQIQGLYGFIEEVSEDGDYYTFNELKRDGGYGGCGAVPDDCLESCNEQWLQDAKDARDSRLEASFRACQRRSKEIKQLMQGIAEKHNLSIKKLYAIQEDLRQLNR